MINAEQHVEKRFVESDFWAALDNPSDPTIASY